MRNGFSTLEARGASQISDSVTVLSLAVSSHSFGRGLCRLKFMVFVSDSQRKKAVLLACRS